jgi:enamine deaminase RidA (YjgF/YER057c/UK114 family)
LPVSSLSIETERSRASTISPEFTTYLVHSQDIEKFMELRAAYFPKIFGKQPYPPNTLLIVDRLVKEDFLLEVEAVLAGRD